MDLDCGDSLKGYRDNERRREKRTLLVRKSISKKKRGNIFRNFLFCLKDGPGNKTFCQYVCSFVWDETIALV